MEKHLFLDQQKKRRGNCSYNEYLFTKKQLEEEYNETLEENPLLIDEISKKLVEKRYCNLEWANKISDRASILNPFSYENLKEEDDIIDKESDRLFQEELAFFVNDMVDSLEKKDAYVLTEYYELKGKRKKTLEEIGKDLKVTKETARKRRNQAEKNLKKKLECWKNYSKAMAFLEYANQGYNNHSVYTKRKIKY